MRIISFIIWPNIGEISKDYLWFLIENNKLNIGYAAIIICKISLFGVTVEMKKKELNMLNVKNVEDGFIETAIKCNLMKSKGRFVEVAEIMIYSLRMCNFRSYFKE